MEGALLLQQAEVEDAGDGDGIGVVGHTILYSGWDWEVGHTKLCVVYITAPHVKCVGGEVMMVDCLQCNQSTIPPPLPAWIYISICSNNKKLVHPSPV